MGTPCSDSVPCEPEKGAQKVSVCCAQGGYQTSCAHRNECFLFSEGCDGTLVRPPSGRCGFVAPPRNNSPSNQPENYEHPDPGPYFKPPPLLRHLAAR